MSTPPFGGLLASTVSHALGPMAVRLAFFAPLTWLCPLLGGRLAPAPARLALALGLALLDLPARPGTTTGIDPSLVTTYLLAGVSVGLLLRLPFDLARSAGEIAAASAGAARAWAGAGLAPPGGSALGLALELCLVAGAPALGLDHTLLRAAVALRVSLETGPLPWQAPALHAGGLFFSSLAGLCLPLLLTTLLLDGALGSAGRLLPHLPLFFLGQPVKALAILGVLCVTLPHLLGAAAATLVPLLRSLASSGGPWP